LTNEDGMRLGELEGIVGEEGGYTAEADAGVLLDGLGIDAALHERKMGELQGGQKVRVLLEMTGVNKLLPIFPTAADAERAFAEAPQIALKP